MQLHNQGSMTPMNRQFLKHSKASERDSRDENRQENQCVVETHTFVVVFAKTINNPLNATSER